MVRSLCLCAALLAVAVLAGAPRPKTSWRMGQEDWDKVEKKLEDGDLPELLVSEDKIAMDEYDRRRGQGLQPPEEEVALKEGNEWLRHTQAMSGPAMMFVSLNPKDPKGELWTKKSLDHLSAEWASLCKTAGLEAKVYDISEGAQDPVTRTRKPTGSATPTPTKALPPARMLVSMNSGWRGYELRDFLLRRPELESLEWDQVKYTPADLDADGNFKGGVLGKNAAPLPAGLADMGPKPTPKKAAPPKKKADFVGPPPKRAPKTPSATPAPSKAAEEEKDEF